MVYPKNSRYNTVNPREIYFYLLMDVWYDFLMLFLLSTMSIFLSVFQEFVFAFTFPFTFSEIMKALLLVEHLLTTGFENSH